MCACTVRLSLFVFVANQRIDLSLITVFSSQIHIHQILEIQFEILHVVNHTAQVTRLACCKTKRVAIFLFNISLTNDVNIH